MAQTHTDEENDEKKLTQTHTDEENDEKNVTHEYTAPYKHTQSNTRRRKNEPNTHRRRKR